MQTLRIEVAGRALSFPPDKVVRIGRSIDADVVLSAVSVSRHHAELRPGPGGWTLVDVGSAGGTFVGGARITELRVTGPLQVQCGPPAAGASFVIVLADQVPAGRPLAQAPAPPPPASPAAPPAAPAAGQPVAPRGAVPPAWPAPAASSEAAAPARPGAPAAPSAAHSGYVPPAAPAAYDEASELTIAPGMGRPVLPGVPPQPMTGPDLLVVAEGKEYRFRHPATITIGRLAECDVAIADQAVSRQHARIVAKPGGWVFQNGSQAGSYVDGRPVASLEFDESTEVRLGHPVAGELLSLVPILSAQEEVARFARKRRNKVLARVGIAAAAVVVVGAVVGTLLVVLGDRGLTESEADRAKAATVFIYAESGSSAWTGSGSILTKDGKILTNAHVADPAKVPALGDEAPTASPDYVYVSLTDAKRDYRVDEPEYRAKVVASDGDLDAAVIQIYAKADGTSVDTDSLSLPTMPLADSDKVEQGQDVTVFGFPGLAREGQPQDFDDLLNQVTQTTGEVATILEDSGERDVFDVTARISAGNSGGAAVDDDGRLVGVPTRVSWDPDAPVSSGRVVPLDYMGPVLDDAGIDVP